MPLASKVAPEATLTAGLLTIVALPLSAKMPLLIVVLPLWASAV